jgi:hypothetical protein
MAIKAHKAAAIPHEDPPLLQLPLQHLLLQPLLLLTLRSNLLHEEKKPLKSGFFIESKMNCSYLKACASYLANCSVSSVNNWKPAGVFSGLPSAS